MLKAMIYTKADLTVINAHEHIENNRAMYLADVHPLLPHFANIIGKQIRSFGLTPTYQVSENWHIISADTNWLGYNSKLTSLTEVFTRIIGIEQGLINDYYYEVVLGALVKNITVSESGEVTLIQGKLPPQAMLDSLPAKRFSLLFSELKFDKDKILENSKLP